ncbi:RING-H2 finger protein ATL66-like [Senna tora]|uniref:RING-H2 finger protein ATL66-like n=1 Tax=Senna tora TaxID=362788 RepID=A0A834U1N2_9FABA|nr:RING-H2 finger protein ATL66-like [Senna tora]
MSRQQDAQVFNWHYSELDERNLEVRGRKVFFIIILFCVILLVTLLFLCARWICRYRHHLPTTFHSIQVRHAPSPPPQGLDLASIKKLPIILHQAPSDSADCALEETECCICLGPFEDGEKLKVLPACNHCFHCECVDNWLINRSSCPLCRSSLKVDDSTFPQILIEEPPIRIDLQF